MFLCPLGPRQLHLVFYVKQRENKITLEIKQMSFIEVNDR